MSALQPGPPPAGEPLSARIARCATLAYVVHGTMNAVDEPDGCKVVPFPAKAPDTNDIHRQLGTDAARALTDRLPDIDFGNGYDPDGPSVNAEKPRSDLCREQNQLPVLLPVYKPFPIDETSIPPRAWAVPGFLMRRHVTVLVAPSGSGKSLLTLQLGLASAKGKSWAGWFPRGKFQVFVVNSEDDIDEMRRRLAAWNADRARAGRSALRHGIGIHTGRVLAGNIGSPDRLSWALVGDPVNVAARLQALNKDFGSEILLSGETARRLEAPAGLEPLSAVTVKGKATAVEVYRVK